MTSNMEQIEFDETFNGNHYQIISRLQPTTKPLSTLKPPAGVAPRATHYLMNGIELPEREWDKQLQDDKQAETGGTQSD